MSTYQALDLTKLLAENTYPGRGIVIGKTQDGKKAVAVLYVLEQDVKQGYVREIGEIFNEKG